MLFKRSGQNPNCKCNCGCSAVNAPKSYSIAAASIIAEVTRDRIMRQWDAVYPEYGFAKHKGYGTAAHIAAIKEYGLCPLHRKSFVKNFI